MIGSWSCPSDWHNSVLRSLCFFITGICLMGPLASETNFPVAPDHANHTAAIVQARLAIDEGQFPLRIAPWQHEGLRYPQFHFYSWLPYWISGQLHKHLFPENPWTALKCCYILAICFSGTWMYAAMRRLNLGESASLAAGFTYITAPYFLTNLYSRGAFTEAIAQAELPLLLWGLLTFQCGSRHHTPSAFAAIAVAVYLLACTHIITFAYGLLFCLCFVFLLTVFRALAPLRVILLVGGLAFGVMLAAHQLLPIVTTPDLAVRSLLSSPMDMKRLSPLSLILSLGPAAPYLTGGEFIPDFWPQVGLPILFAACAAMLALTGGVRGLPVQSKTLLAALISFSLAVISASGTFDIWRYLPAEFAVIQFPYRLLTFTALFGAVIAGLVAHIVSSRYQHTPLVLILLALLSAAIWQPKMDQSSLSLAQAMNTPDLGYGSTAYLISKTSALPLDRQSLLVGPLVHGDGWLNLSAKLRFFTAQMRKSGGALKIAGHQVPQSQGCQELHVTVGSNKIVVPSKMTPFTAVIPAEEILKAAGNVNDFEVGFNSPCAFVPGPQDPRRLFMYATALEFVESGTWILSQEAKRLCRMDNDQLRCQIQSATGGKIQLPVLYYPNNLLSVEVNGIAQPIAVTEKGNFVLATVDFRAGSSVIVAKFQGHFLGNTHSCPN